MVDRELNSLIRQGVSAVEKGNTLMALVHLEEAAKLDDSPLIRSYLGLCLARERNQLQKAVKLCNEALQQEPHNPVHFLNLGRIYLQAGQKTRAIQAWRRGLRAGRNPLIIQELKQLGLRRLPVFGALGREHPLNKYLGILLKKLGMR